MRVRIPVIHDKSFREGCRSLIGILGNVRVMVEGFFLLLMNIKEVKCRESRFTLYLFLVDFVFYERNEPMVYHGKG